MELADTSAWTNRHKRPDVASQFSERIATGEVATCDLVKLELLRMTQDHREFVQRRQELDELSSAPITAPVWRRAIDVMETFASRGPLHHRQVGLQDLLVAAAAELAELPVLHYDRHFELIAEVTGQPVRAIAPLGSLG
jgi:predicted nucleic acid-binding protein